MRGRRSRIPITPEVPSWTTNDKQYYEEMEKEVQALIDEIGSLAASSRQHIKNVFYRILAGQTNIEWLARYEAQLPPQGIKQLRNLMRHYSQIAMDFSISGCQKTEGLRQFLEEKQPANDNPLVRLARLIRQRRYNTSREQLDRDDEGLMQMELH